MDTGFRLLASPITLIPNSLAARLLATTIAWTVLALLVTGLVLTALFRSNAEQEFNGLLLAHTYNLMGSIDIDPSGDISASPNLGDPRFLTPQSGWYWTIARAANPTEPLAHSRSISGGPIELPDVSEQPFNDLFQRIYVREEAGGDLVQRLEAQVSVGDQDALFQVMVAASRVGLEARISQFRTTLVLAFLLFGIGTIIATYFVIRFGLQPLKHAARALNQVREGDSDHVEGDYPKEVAPLVSEINGLIGANRAIVERARTQVGNLAHALKTPLAVIANETRSKKDRRSETIADQTGLMQSQIQTYLNRARIAAQSGTITARAPVQPLLAELVRVMGKLSPDLKFDSKCPSTLVFAGEAQDLQEILGNLLENASHYARSRVVVSAAPLPISTGKRPTFELMVEDDRRGVTKAQRAEILKRGKRLDESVPGSGLGLSIVKDIVDEYGGDISLSESSLGGLAIVMILPMVRATMESQST